MWFEMRFFNGGSFGEEWWCGVYEVVSMMWCVMLCGVETLRGKCRYNNVLVCIVMLSGVLWWV